MNGYFGLKATEKGTHLILKPPTEGGDVIRSNEIKDYLSSLGIELDFKALNSAVLKSKDTKVVLYVAAEQIPAVDERVNFEVSFDKMHVFARFIPACGGKKLTQEDIINKLHKAGFQSGVDEKKIEQIVLQKRYCTDYEIVTGKLPTAGRDATIKYHFNTDNSVRPTLKEDGSVDFFHLNNINHCKEGDVLAEIIPKEKGEDGFDVFGTVLPAREVSDTAFKYGMNIELSEDGMRLISSVHGHVQLIEGTVFAADVYEIENVGPSTGNVEYNGNIQINGNVEDNYSVHANGTIEIRGTVGAANIEADGDIIIANGMYGQGKGKLKAKGNIIAKFIESTTVDAGGFVEAESILHSYVKAGTDVNVEAKKGFITGGKICANNVIKAKLIGSAMGSNTVLEVGVDGNIKERFVELQKSVMERKKAIKQIQPVLESSLQRLSSGEKVNAMQADYIKQLQTSLNEQQQALEDERYEMNKLSGQLTGSKQAHIDVSNTIYAGTSVSVSGVSIVVKDSMKRCRLVREGAEVKMTGF